MRAYEINQRQPYLQDKRVRQAFDYALDKEAIRKTIMAGTGRAATSTIVGPDWAINPSIKPRPYDPDKAKALLKEAGWDFNRKLVYFQYLIPPLGEAFQGYLSQIGVPVEAEGGAGRDGRCRRRTRASTTCPGRRRLLRA